jgi:hypothetical protein
MHDRAVRVPVTVTSTSELDTAVLVLMDLLVVGLALGSGVVMVVLNAPFMDMGVARCVSTTVAVWVSVAGEAPDQEARAGEHQQRTDDMALLSLDLLPELKPDQCNDAGQHERCQHMPARRESAYPRHPTQAPALGAANDG